ncbi:MAG: DUF4168 domain-containing protein [Leptolyngbyaceae cyanobacterium CSU_1_4]|nr:DUF4168 domain-containing protein [Leptolyngbyaceae cyanobacterium CSU_1_4]
MIMRDRSNLLKNLLVMSAAGASLLVSLPALSQTSNESSAPEDIVMSAEGMKILCEVTPLNSRCPDGEQPTAVPSSSEPRESAVPPASVEPQMAPTDSPQFSLPSETTPPSVEPSAPEPSGSMSPGDKPSSDSMESPGSTPGSAMPASPAPEPQSLTAPGANSPTATPAPSMVPSDGKAATLTKGEADALRTETPASAQTPNAPGTTPAQSPTRAPASPEAPSAAPTSPQSPSGAPATETPAAVSPAELQKFAEVIPQLQEIQKTAQQQVSEAIKKAGLSEDRFRELYSVQQSPTTAQASTPATPQEQQAVQQVATQLETIQSETQTRRVQAVESQGLELTRFNEILTAVRQDADLQQQLQQILNN